MRDLELLKDLVLIRPTEPPSKIGTILIPENVHITVPNEGVILKIGPGKSLPDGTIRPMTVKPDQFVMYHAYEMTRVKVNGEELLLMSEDSIHAIIHVTGSDIREEPKTVDDYLKAEGLPTGRYGEVIKEPDPKPEWAGYAMPTEPAEVP